MRAGFRRGSVESRERRFCFFTANVVGGGGLGLRSRPDARGRRRPIRHSACGWVAASLRTAGPRNEPSGSSAAQFVSARFSIFLSLSRRTVYSPHPPPIFQTREFGGVYSIKYQPEATAHVHVHAHAHVYVGCAWSCKARTTRTTHTALRAHLVFARDDRSRPPRSASRELMIAAVSTARERCGLPAPRHPALHLKPFDQHAGVVNDDGSLEPRSTQRHDR